MSNPRRCSVALPWGQHPLYSSFLVSAHVRDSDDNMMSFSVCETGVEIATNKVKSYYIMRVNAYYSVFFFF